MSMNIGQAMEAMKTGSVVARQIWTTQGRNWKLYYTAGVSAVPAANFTNAALAAFVATLPGGVANVEPAVYLRDGANNIHLGWAAEQVDMFAEDWYIVT
jgi:hypothetical protein